MVLEGKVWKDKKHWLIEVPALDVMTQGRSRHEAFSMLKDAIALLCNQKGFRLNIRTYDRSIFVVGSNDQKTLLALMLKRQRAKHNLSIAGMAERLHVKSKNTYAQYEQGRNEPSFGKMQEFLTAMNPKAVVAFTVFER